MPAFQNSAFVDGGPATELPVLSLWQWLSSAGKDRLDHVAVKILHHGPDHLSALTGVKSTDSKPHHLVWTYRQLLHSVECVASALAAKGTNAGDVICTLIPNCVEWVIMLWACARLGAIFAPLDPSHVNRDKELKYVLDLLEPKAIIVSDKVAATVCDRLSPTLAVKLFAGTEKPTSWQSLLELVRKESPVPPHPAPRPSETAFIYFTSGSTGMPKCVPKTEKAMQSCIADYHSFAGSSWSVNSRYFVTENNFRPICAEGTTQSWTVGGSVIIPGPVFDPVTALTDIMTHKCTHLITVPAILTFLIRSSKEQGAIPSSLTFVPVCGDLVNPDLLNQAKDLLHIERLTVLWGMTEGVPVFGWQNDEPIPATSQNIAGLGRVLPGSKAKICVPGQDRATRRDFIGELHVHSRNMTNGYIGQGQPLDTFYRDTDGLLWCKTGDLAMIDSSGVVFVVGRSKDIIKFEGDEVLPSVVDNYVNELFDLEAKTVGVPGGSSGTLVVVITLQCCTESVKEDIKSRSQNHLGSEYKITEVYSLSELGLKEWPRNGSGKVNKLRLAQLATEKRDDDTVCAAEYMS